MAESCPPLDKAKHIKYWQRCYKSFLPRPYTAYDSTRLTFAYFIVAALDLLSVPFTPTERAAMREWVLSLQHPDGGFCGSSTHAYTGQDASKGTPNIAATAFALLMLAVAADGEAEAKAAFTGVDRVKILNWLRRLQRSDGSFGQNEWDGEIAGGKDTRHSYLAACIRWILRGDVKEGEEGWVEDIDVDAMVAHIRRGQTFDGGLAETSRNESHAGYAYTAVGTLALLDRPLDASQPSSGNAIKNGIPNRENLLRFLAYRPFAYLKEEEDEDEEEEAFIEAELGKQAELTADGCVHVGYNGRWNKKADSCYTWWVAGTLSMLGDASVVNVPGSRKYLLDITQHAIGGFSKAVGAPPDIYHAYLSLAALATMGDPDLKEFDVELCSSRDTTRKLEQARDGLLESMKNGAGGWDNDGFWDAAN